ncbi:T9SS type A sorting domain-containing protein [Adhaeribacter pallidiroseus]|uniref:Secretion system C-terminal sorting domain-containing protein n=1 Tax=Adhaeribacter pallidiroseus TaxID=2072847 RepID=A0A369QJI5_9BACT|nr:T9SS type A sorting domain-containing protein [Adhaeribacter pallidiroseus]RDC64884.1 hypothetical protein AHMF7616_03506 [Adhaeribacter pallidiroseus]
MRKLLLTHLLLPFRSNRPGSWVIFFFLNFNLVYLASAQNILWEKTLGGPGSEYLSTIRLTRDGGYILGGTSNSPVSGDKTDPRRGETDYWIIKYHADGTKAWDKTYGGHGGDGLRSIQQTQDGGYILGGTSGSGNTGDKSEKSRGQSDYWMIKIDAQGKKQWDKTYGGSQTDQLVAIQQTPDGGYLVGGDTYSNVSGDKTLPSFGYTDFWVLKLDAAGNKVWEKTFGGKLFERFRAITATPDGNFILAGDSDSKVNGNKTAPGKGQEDYWLIKIKPDGTKIWEKAYGGSDGDNLATLQPTQDGGYILGGWSTSGISGDKSEENKSIDSFVQDYWVIKVDAEGTKQWDKTLGGDEADQLTTLRQTQDGSYLVGGISESAKSDDKSQSQIGGEGTADFWVVKLSATGKFIADKTIGGSKRDILWDLQQTPDGNFLLGGSSDSQKSGNKSQNSKGNTDIWLVKIDDKFKKNQAISFPPLYNQVLAKAPITLSAKANSGLPVSFEVRSGAATIQGNQLTLTGPGPVRIAALQPGNATYNPTETIQTFTATLNGRQADYTFGGSQADTLASVIATPDGGYLLGGTSNSGASGSKSQNAQGSTDYWIVKINKAGQKLWDKTYGGKDQDKLTALVATPDGGYLLGGSSVSGQTGDKSQAGKGKSDYWILKINATGEKVWDKTYGGRETDQLAAIIVTPKGYLLGGSSASGTSPDKSQASKGLMDYWVLEVDHAGNKLWDKTYGGSKTDKLAALLASPAGGFLVGGSSASEVSGDKSQPARSLTDYWVIRINEQGTIVWDKTYGGSKVADRYVKGDFIESANSYLSALVPTPDGGYLVGGSSSAVKGFEKSEDNIEPRYEAPDYWVLKINSQGEKVWDNTYGGESYGSSWLSAIVAAPTGGYLLAGTSDLGKGRDKTETSIIEDFWIININEQGKKLTDRTITGSYLDYLSAAVKTPDGNFLLAGYSESEPGADKKGASLGGTDYWLVQVSSTEVPDPGVLAWDYTIGWENGEQLMDVIRTRDGGYLAAGTTFSIDEYFGGKIDYYLAKVNKAGEYQYTTTIGGTANDYLNRVIQTQDGGYLLAGTSLSGISKNKTQASQGKQDYWLIKLDTLGNKQWDKRFGGSGSDDLRKVVQLPTGEYVLGGTSNSSTSGDKSQSTQGGTDYWLLKISKNGNKIWDKRYGGSANETLGSFVVTEQGGFLLAGTSQSGKSGDKTQANQGSTDYWLVNTDAAGNVLWDKAYGGSGADQLFSLSRRGNSYFLAGTSRSGKSGDKTQAGKGGNDYWILKINATGTKLWDKTFGGSDDDDLRASTFTNQGLYVIAGTSYSEMSGDKTQSSRGGSDYWVVAVDDAGNPVYDQRFGGTGNEELRAVLQTRDGGFLLGGFSDSGQSGDKSEGNYSYSEFYLGGESTDFWLVKVAPIARNLAASRQTSRVEETIVLDKHHPLQAYPNPFREKVTINFILPETQPATVKILDGHGRAVTTLFQDKAQANQTYQLEWQAGKQASGMYLLQLQTPTGQNTQKLLLTR